MTTPISIVITTYNRERYLSATIESILAQTRCDFELLIWDDGSTDRSVEIANAYAKAIGECGWWRQNIEDERPP
jgi:glycosyltransferase involved in cell wall biosynthesis